MHHKLGDLKPFAFFDVIAVVVIAVSGGSKGGAGGPALPLFLDQTKARRAGKKTFKDSPPPPYLRVLMTRPPPYLKAWIRH